MGGNIIFRKSLVIFQFIITVVMIAGSVVIYKQLQFALHTNLGFNKDQVLTFHIDDRKVRGELPSLKTQLLQSPLIKDVAAVGNPIGNNDLGNYPYQYEKNDGAISNNPANGPGINGRSGFSENNGNKISIRQKFF